jgi:hypothetical protein
VPSALWLLWIAVIVFALTNYLQRGELVRRLVQLERRVQALARHVGLDPDAAFEAEVAALARSGRRAEAIRRYRRGTGATWLESARAVEELTSRRPPTGDG